MRDAISRKMYTFDNASTPDTQCYNTNVYTYTTRYSILWYT